ncbi:1720_t:CDS:2, partial [Entrophospora sp. SA101]
PLQLKSLKNTISAPRQVYLSLVNIPLSFSKILQMIEKGIRHEDVFGMVLNLAMSRITSKKVGKYSNNQRTVKSRISKKAKIEGNI